MGGPPVFARTWLCWSLAERGEFDEALAYGQEGVEIAAAHGLAWGRVAADCGLGVVHLRRGDGDRAIELLERAYAIVRAGGVDLWLPTTGSALGCAYTLAGRIDEAIDVLRFTADPVAFGNAANGALRFGYLGEAMLNAGWVESSSQVAAQALELAEARHERGHQAWAFRLLGEIAAQQHPAHLAPAEAHYLKALDLSRDLGMRPLQAHCHRGLARLYERLGRSEQAETAAAAADRLYQALDMRRWLTRPVRI
jgi:tetratricopeptide (TPR) repeat protein